MGTQLDLFGTSKRSTPRKKKVAKTYKKEYTNPSSAGHYLRKKKTPASVKTVCARTLQKVGHPAGGKRKKK